MKLASGVHNHRYRYHSPSLGRWLATDPIGFKAKDVNLYRYGSGNSINSTDPTGLINSAEKAWCCANPGCCANSIFSKGVTEEELRNRYGDAADADGVWQNAVKHCTWMCYVGTRPGCTTAQACGLGDAHEQDGGGFDANNAMDLHNNAAGIQIAQTMGGGDLSDCASACDQAARDGDPYWLNGGGP